MFHLVVVRSYNAALTNASMPKTMRLKNGPPIPDLIHNDISPIARELAKRNKKKVFI